MSAQQSNREKVQQPARSYSKGLSPQMPPDLPYEQDQVTPVAQYEYQVGQAHQQEYDQQQLMMHHQQSHSAVIITQPTAAVQNDSIISAKDGQRDWNTGLFSCFEDVTQCVWVMCCPCLVHADISKRLGEHFCVTFCVTGGLLAERTRVRTLGGIRGSICKDYLATECCQPCVICQLQREIEYMGL